MKPHYKLLAALLFGLVQTSCTVQNEKADSSVPNYNPVTYEIFIQSFADSNGDGIGDIPGMTSKLDYLSELGIGAVWLMPIHPSPSYHKYDVTNYYDIHPDYGTLDDFKIFVEEAHKRNIKVVIDMIINHSSDKNPMFISSANNEDLYRDYFVWANKDSIAAQISKKETSFDSDNIRQWHAVDGDSTKEHYYGFFTGAMPDLNFDYKPVRDEVIVIGKFWLEEVGVDGFRLDAAKHIYPDDRVEDNVKFWKDYISAMQTINPDVYTVGEVWANADLVSEFVPGFKGLFNFDLAFSILESVKRGRQVSSSIDGHGWKVEEESFLAKLELNRDRYKSINPDYEDAIFLSNHDQNRFLDVLEGDEIKAKVAASILLTLPGRPYIYYGEEIGMHGMKPDPNIREPFLWNVKSLDAARTSWIEPKFTTDETVIPLEQQLTDPNSIFTHYRELIRLRNSHPILHSGEMENLEETDGIIAFFRVLNEEKMLVLHNISEVPMEVDLTNHEGLEKLKIYGQGSIQADEALLPPYSSLVIK